MQLPEGLPCARARCSEKPYFGKANLESRVIYFPISPSPFAQSAGHRGEELRLQILLLKLPPSWAAPLNASWVCEDGCATAPPAGLRDPSGPRGPCSPRLSPARGWPDLTPTAGTSQQGARGWGPAACRQRQPPRSHGRSGQGVWVCGVLGGRGCGIKVLLVLWSVTSESTLNLLM